MLICQRGAELSCAAFHSTARYADDSRTYTGETAGRPGEDMMVEIDEFTFYTALRLHILHATAGGRGTGRSTGKINPTACAVYRYFFNYWQTFARDLCSVARLDLLAGASNGEHILRDRSCV